MLIICHWNLVLCLWLHKHETRSFLFVPVMWVADALMKSALDCLLGRDAILGKQNVNPHIDIWFDDTPRLSTAAFCEDFKYFMLFKQITEWIGFDSTSLRLIPTLKMPCISLQSEMIDIELMLWNVNKYKMKKLNEKSHFC